MLKPIIRGSVLPPFGGGLWYAAPSCASCKANYAALVPESYTTETPASRVDGQDAYDTIGTSTLLMRELRFTRATSVVFIVGASGKR